MNKILAAALILVSVSAQAGDHQPIRQKVFGQMPDGTDVLLFTLSLRGHEVAVMEYGATLVAVRTPDRDGKLDNVNLGLDDFDAYLAGHPVLGSTIGRFANRIAGAKFEIDGEEHGVTPNSRGDHIHGGKMGYAKRLIKMQDGKIISDEVQQPRMDEDIEA